MTRTAPGYITKYNANSGLYELHYAGANAPRGSKWKDKNGLTIIGFNGEVERTNLFLQANDISTTWTKITAGDTISTNQAVDHSGNTIMDAVVADATDTVHGVTQDITLTAASYALFGVAKKGAKDWLYVSDDTVANCTGYWDLNNGVVGTKGDGANLIDIISLGGGLYVWILTVTGTVAAHTIKICAAHANEDNDFAGDGSAKSVYLSRLNATLGVYASSFIDTTTAAATKTADTPIRLSAIDNVAAGKGHAMFDFVMKSKPTAARTLMEISDGGSASDRIYLIVNPSGYLTLYSVAASTVYGPVQLATDFCDNKKYRVGATWKSGYLNLFVRDLYTETLYGGTAETTVSIPDDLDRLEYGVTEYGIMTQPMIHGVPLYGAQAVPFNY